MSRGHVGVPADLQPLKEPLVEAVIDAYMAKKMTEGTDFEFDHGGCDKGEFRYHVPRFGIDTKAYVSYPGGQFRIDQWLDPDDEVDPGTHVGEITTLDSAPIELYTGDDVRIVHSKLRAVAGRIEHVGDHQRSVAGMLGGAAASGGWSRGYLQGSIIGWAPTGHHGDLESVVDGLVDLLLLESRTAHRVAEHCLQVSTGFRLTDEQVEATLDRLESRLGG